MESTGHVYTERLYAPVSWWLLGLVIVVAIGWAFFVATPLSVTVVATAVAFVIVTTVLWTYGAVRLTVDAKGLRAGRAALPFAYVGTVTALDADATRRAIGQEADARAFLVLRSYCPGAVTVAVDDDRDPTPYWLVSTRHPTALAASLTDRVVQD